MNKHYKLMLLSLFWARKYFNKIIFYSLIVILVYFLFEVGGGEERHRLIQGIWNLGHFVLFMLLCIAYLNTDLFNKKSIIFKISIITMASLILGTGTELIQLLVQRDFSIHDIASDVIGAYLGLLIHIIRDKTKTSSTRFGASFLALFFLSIACRDFGVTVMDEIALYNDFPVLASFESEAEIKRWELVDVHAVQDERFFISGNHSLKVEYLPAIYPSISLVHMKSDWRGYKQLSFSVFSMSQQDIPFEIKVHDKYHTQSRGGYSDRFNRNITIKHGWNFIDIPISEIASSPNGRCMDIRKINKISLFTHNLIEPTTIYIDNIRLI